VDGGDAGAAPELVQERRVAVADDQLGGDGGELRREPEEAVAAARASVFRMGRMVEPLYSELPQLPPAIFK